MTFENAFRMCGGTWELCNGKCGECEKARVQYTNTTDDTKSVQDLIYEACDV